MGMNRSLDYNGRIIDLTGSNYNTIFWVASAFMILAIVCMLFVTRGEAKTESRL